MAVIHKGVDKIIDGSNNEVVISVASTTIAAVNDASTGLSSKASTADLTAGLNTKLDSTAQAVDSAKLGNMAPSHYATQSDLTNGLAAKLDATATAADSSKLGGVNASDYVKTSVTNNFTAEQRIDITTTGPAFKVTQRGSGNAFEVHDEASDTTPFKINSTGAVYTGDLLAVESYTASDARIEVGANRTADGYAYIDLIGDTNFTNYGTRLMRERTGPNADTKLLHRGNGRFTVAAEDGAVIGFDIQQIPAMELMNTGVEIINDLNIGGAATINGKAIATTDDLANVSGSTASLNDIGDVDTTGLQSGMVLMWNGSQWEPGVVASGPRTVEEATKTNGVLAGGGYCWFSGGWNDRTDVYGQSFSSTGTYSVMSGSQEGRGHCSDGTYAYFAGGTNYGGGVGRSSFSSAAITQGWSNLSPGATGNWKNGTSNGSHAFWSHSANYNNSAWPVKTAHADGSTAYHEVSLLGSNLDVKSGSPTGTDKFARHGVGNGVHCCSGDYWITKFSMWDTAAATYHVHGTPNPGGGSDQSTNGELIIGFHGRDNGSSSRHNRTMTTSFTDVNAQWTSHTTYGTSTNGSACGNNGTHVINHGGDYGSHRTSQGQRTSWANLAGNTSQGGSARHGHHGNLVPNG